MFHFPAYPPHTAVPAHDGRWVPPFGNPRIKALLAAPRGISQPQTSFIGPVCQGIHHTPLQATRTTRCAWPQGSFLANSQTTNHHTKMITKRSKQTLKKEFDSKSTARTRNQKETPSCSRPLSSSQATTHHHAVRTGPARHQARWASNRARPKPGVAIREPKSASAPLPRNIPRRTNRKPMISSTPAAPDRRDCRGVGVRTAGRTSGCILRRKEVIQPHLPVRLPCYDLVPITSLTLDGSLPQGVRPPASGAAHFHDLTGGVYKARERIHRDVADSRLLATPPSRSRVADCDPN